MPAKPCSGVPTVRDPATLIRLHRKFYSAKFPVFGDGLPSQLQYCRDLCLLLTIIGGRAYKRRLFPFGSLDPAVLGDACKTLKLHSFYPFPVRLCRKRIFLPEKQVLATLEER